MALLRARQVFDEAPLLWGCAGATAVIVTGVVTYRMVRDVSYKWTVVRERREYQEKKRLEKLAVASRSRVTKEDVEKICNLSLLELHEELQKGRVSASEVLKAYMTKAGDVDEKVNVITEYITEAQAQAKELDEAATKKPLHGLPMSVKEHHHIEGYPTTAGIFTLINDIATDTLPVTKVLRNQGAVPFVRTNTPYTSLSYTMWNPLYGISANPLDLDRHPGGSSGGEAALVATGATALSIGGDIGGSIRQPANWCGIVGLKCGSTRLSILTRTDSILNTELSWTPALPVAFGPMARDVDSAAFIMRHLLVDDMFKHDPYTAPVPFRHEIYMDRKPLRIGYYNYDYITKTVPTASRAVDLVKAKLEDQGHTLVQFDIPLDAGGGQRWLDLYYQIISADGGLLLNRLVDGDVGVPGDLFQKPMLKFPNLPRWFNVIASKIHQLFSKEWRQMRKHGCGAGSVLAYWDLVFAVLAWRSEVLKKFQDEQIDVLLSPAFCCPAMLKKHFYSIDEHGSYLLVYNLLDWPAGVLPVTRVTSQDIHLMEGYPNDTATCRNIIEGMQNAEGLPMGVQIAAPPYGEELCLRVMKEIEEIVQFKRDC